MFFAQTLGPALSVATGAALHNHLKSQFNGREDIPFAEFSASVSDYLRSVGYFSAPETGIDLLIRMGRVRVVSGADGYVVQLRTGLQPERLAS